MIKENLEENRINIVCAMLGLEKKVNNYGFKARGSQTLLDFYATSFSK